MNDNLLNIFSEYNGVIKESFTKKTVKTNKGNLVDKADNMVTPLCRYQDVDVYLVEDSKERFIVEVEGNRLIVLKSVSEFDGDGRYLYLDKEKYDNIYFDVEDGRAVSKHFDVETLKNPKNAKNVIEIYFPKIREIFSSPELIDEAFSYSYDINEFGSDFLELIEEVQKNQGWNVFKTERLFEGFFFNFSKNVKPFVNGKKVK